MELELNINGVIKSLEVAPHESLLTVLRREGYYSVKHGCESGECGACAVLVDGVPRPSCVTLAAQAGGCSLTTIESLGKAHKLHPLQEAFIDTGAVQCGFCTPGMLLCAAALLKRNANPSEEEVREALSGNLCRCTGYVKPVRAVLRAAAVLRGETVAPLSSPVAPESTQSWEPSRGPLEPRQGNHGASATATMVEARPVHGLSVVGQAVRSIDAVKLVTGKPTFTDDIELRGMLYARVLTSPHAHAVIREIDVTEARALPGVHAVLTYKDVPRVPYTRAGLPWPESGPHDQYALDNRVRFVGDRVAVVAAETPELVEQALKLITVDYEILPALLDPRLATSAQAPCLHPEEGTSGVHDAVHNVAAYVRAACGDVERGFGQAELVVESEYVVPQAQPAPLENPVVITYWDEDERLVIRSSTSVPQHVRRIIAPVIGLPPRRIRVIAPRVGGDFGAKQDIFVEDLCALLTIATNRPVRLEFTRAEALSSSHVRHAQIIRMKTGVKRDGTLVANSMMVLANTGAYGSHALSASRNTGLQTLPLYPCPHLYFEAQVVYTNQPPAGACRGYSAPQGFFALECHLDEIARQLNMDALELRRKNWLKVGDKLPLVCELGETKEHIVQSSGLAECLRIVEEKVQWKEKRGKGGTGRFRRGVGVALAMHGPTTASQHIAGASLKLNEDGSFDLFVGTVENGSGAHTLLAQIAAEVLGVRSEDIVVHGTDTDALTYASDAGVYANAGAVKQVAERVREQILSVAGQILKSNPALLLLQDRVVSAPTGQGVTIAQVALHALYVESRQQIMAAASWLSQQASPAFAAQGAEVEVDTESGMVRVIRAISVVEAGCVLHPLLTEGQIESGAAQALGSGISEELVYDSRGGLLTANLSDYRILNAPDMPVMEAYIVQTEDPTGPFGAKDSAEIPVDAMAAAVANAVADALGMRLRQIPLTPERVLRVLRAQAQTRSGR